MLDSVGSQVCVFSTPWWYPCCVSISTARCRTHTHLYTTLQRTCALILPYNCHLPSLEWARLRHTKVACRTSWIVVAPTLTDLETRRLVFYYFTFLIAHACMCLPEISVVQGKQIVGRPESEVACEYLLWWPIWVRHLSGFRSLFHGEEILEIRGKMYSCSLRFSACHGRVCVRLSTRLG